MLVVNNVAVSGADPYTPGLAPYLASSQRPGFKIAGGRRRCWMKSVSQISSPLQRRMQRMIDVS